MWYGLHNSRGLYNEEGQRLIDRMADWADHNYEIARRFQRPYHAAMEHMGAAYDALTGSPTGTGVSQLGYAYGGEDWLLSERITGGVKSAVDFVVAGTASLLTDIALQPDPDLAALNPDLAERMRTNARIQSESAFRALSWSPTNPDQLEAYCYGMTAQGTATLAYGAYGLVKGGVGMFRALRTDALRSALRLS